MDLSRIRAIYNNANNLEELITNLLDRIDSQYTIFNKDKREYIVLTNTFYQLRDNTNKIINELNSSLKIMKFNLINENDLIYINNDEVKTKLKIINIECRKIRDFLKEYLKFDDGLTYLFEEFFRERVKELAIDDFQRIEYLNAVRKVFVEINDQV